MFSDPITRAVVVITLLLLAGFWTLFGFLLAWIFGYVG